MTNNKNQTSEDTNVFIKQSKFSVNTVFLGAITLLISVCGFFARNYAQSVVDTQKEQGKALQSVIEKMDGIDGNVKSIQTAIPFLQDQIKQNTTQINHLQANYSLTK